MLDISNMHGYQHREVERIIENPNVVACGGAAGLLDMGLGKTVITLTAIDELLFNFCAISKVLVIAPLLVAQNTWTDEVQTWKHLSHLRTSRVLGTERQRLKALQAKADIYIINRENVVWLVTHYGTAWPFDMVVIDELSSFKDSDTRRFRALRKVMPLVKRRVGLTGTPGDLLKLWSQYYLLDFGERLGPTLTGYRNKYFNVTSRLGAIALGYEVRKGEDPLLGENIYEAEIYDKISDISSSMKAKDYLDLPERIDRTVRVVLPPEIMKAYTAFERSQVMALNDVEVTALNAAGLYGKLKQFSNGAVYDENKVWHLVHDEKLKRLAEMVEDLDGAPALILYNYRSDLERIMQALVKYKPVKIGSGKDDLANWNAGKIRVAVGHPASMGHGLNMQKGGHNIIWFGPNPSHELNQQTIKRLDRQGQKMPVVNNYLVCVGTIDEDAMESLGDKVAVEDAIMRAVKVRMAKYLKSVVI